MQTLGQRVTQLRTAKGLTQDQLAARAGVAQSTINGIERGARQKMPSSLIEIAHALGVDAFWLKTGIGDKPELDKKYGTAPTIPLTANSPESPVYVFQRQDDAVTAEIIEIARGLDDVGKGMLVREARAILRERSTVEANKTAAS